MSHKCFYCGKEDNWMRMDYFHPFHNTTLGAYAHRQCRIDMHRNRGRAFKRRVVRALRRSSEIAIMLLVLHVLMGAVVLYSDPRVSEAVANFIEGAY